MLVHLIALLHGLVQLDLLLRSDDGLPADGACVVMVSPAQETLDMKDVINIALELHNLIIGLEIDEADGALVAKRHHLFAIAVFLEIFDFFKLLFASLCEACFEFEEDASHTHGVDSQIDRLTS